MARMKFSNTTCKRLGHYVYLYIDPRDQRVFYVGKGLNNRCFSHLNDLKDTAKVQRIQELRKLDLEPIIEILRYGLTESEALQVESAAIDLLGLDELTNKVHGHGSSSVGRSGVDELNATLDAREVQIDQNHKVILININKNFVYGMSVHELYDATRCAWRVSPERHNPEFAFSVFRGVVREVFTISGWLPGGTTMKSGDRDGRPIPREGRWEFVGQVAEPDIRKKYIGKSVSSYWKKGAQNPIMYVNC